MANSSPRPNTELVDVGYDTILEAIIVDNGHGRGDRAVLTQRKPGTKSQPDGPDLDLAGLAR